MMMAVVVVMMREIDVKTIHFEEPFAGTSREIRTSATWDTNPSSNYQPGNQVLNHITLKFSLRPLCWAPLFCKIAPSIEVLLLLTD